MMDSMPVYRRQVVRSRADYGSEKGLVASNSWRCLSPEPGVLCEPSSLVTGGRRIRFPFRLSPSSSSPPASAIALSDRIESQTQLVIPADAGIQAKGEALAPW